MTTNWTRTQIALSSLGGFLRCPLCSDYYKDPYTVAECEHNFCQTCIREYLHKSIRYCCPVRECRVPTWDNSLKRNPSLEGLVSSFRQLASITGFGLRNIDNEECTPSPSPSPSPSPLPSPPNVMNDEGDDRSSICSLSDDIVGSVAPACGTYGSALSRGAELALEGSTAIAAEAVAQTIHNTTIGELDDNEGKSLFGNELISKSTNSDDDNDPVCVLCGFIGQVNIMGQYVGPYKIQRRGMKTSEEVWTHIECIRWSIGGGQWLFDGHEFTSSQVDTAGSIILHALKVRCNHCKRLGATLVCASSRCRKAYHYLCALECDCQLVSSTVHCATHRTVSKAMKQTSIDSYFSSDATYSARRNVQLRTESKRSLEDDKLPTDATDSERQNVKLRTGSKRSLEDDELPASVSRRRNVTVKENAHTPISMTSNSQYGKFIRKCKNVPVVENTKQSTARCKKMKSSTAMKKVVSRIGNIRRNKHGETPLHLAARKGDLTKIRQLCCDYAVDLDTPDNAGWTSLTEACNHGHVDVVKELLNRGSDPLKAGLDGITPLHDTISSVSDFNICSTICRLLISAGARLDHPQNSLGQSPGALAAERDGDGAELLLSLERFEKAVLEEQSSRIPTVPKPSLLDEGSRSTEEVKIATECDRSGKSIKRQNLASECTVLLTGLVGDQKKRTLTQLQQLGCGVADIFGLNVTHVVGLASRTGSCSRTTKYLHGILAGCWIVSNEWIMASFDKAFETSSERISDIYMACEREFEIKGDSFTTGGPQRARSYHSKRLPLLFDGCNFFLKGNFGEPGKSGIRDLIISGGGHILIREPKMAEVNAVYAAGKLPFHAAINTCSYFIVMDNLKLEAHIILPGLCKVPVSWLLDCISTYSILPAKSTSVKRRKKDVRR